MNSSTWIGLCALFVLVRELHSLVAKKESTLVSSLKVEDQYEWTTWKETHGRYYSSNIEELERYIIWRSNKFYIQCHNNYSAMFGFTLKMNQFGDMSSQEYTQYTRCLDKYKVDQTLEQLNWTYFDSNMFKEQSLPQEMDWRASGAVTGVKDQGRCRSCYAFSVTGALEGLQALSTGRLYSLSEQNIVDCSVPYGNSGCSGGARETAILYVVDNDGVDTSQSYPYIAKQYLCKFSEETVGATCTGMVRVQKGSEQDLQAAVAVAGPVTIAIDSRHTSFQFYFSGIYNEPLCSKTKLTHSMLVIGYGTKNNLDYWLLKNSWGTMWGMDGFIMMRRNSYNQCGIATSALYPTV